MFRSLGKAGGIITDDVVKGVEDQASGGLGGYLVKAYWSGVESHIISFSEEEELVSIVVGESGGTIVELEDEVELIERTSSGSIALLTRV